MASTTIRRDLYAVQVLTDADVGTGHEEWTIIRIFDHYRTAKYYIRDHIPSKRDFPGVPPRIVHPSQRVVDLFYAYNDAKSANLPI